MKQVLDETTAKVVLKKFKHQEDNTLSNFKIVVAIFSCIVAVASHFYPKPFPENRNILIACSVTYFGLNLLLQLIATVKEKNFILFTLPQKNSGLKALEVSTTLDRVEPIYNVAVGLRRTGAGKQVSKDFDITAFFDEQGNFYENLFQQQLKPLLAELENGSKSH